MVRGAGQERSRSKRKTMNSPNQKNPAAVELGRLGGKAGRGPAKGMPPGKGKKAAEARWKKAEGKRK